MTRHRTEMNVSQGWDITSQDEITHVNEQDLVKLRSSLPQVKTLVYVFEHWTQNWFSVASIFEDVLTQLKQMHPRIDEAFLRSDNAGCYHCGPLMLTAPGISKRVGIPTDWYDFSDPQSGKDICDRRIATMKNHMRRYLNEGNDINSACDMNKALDSYCGVKGCRVSVASTDTSEQELTQHKWSGIQSFNNFEFQRLGIRVWKTYGIGKGKLTRKQDLKKISKPQTKTGLTVNTADDQQLQRGFACSELGCVKVSVSINSWEHHLNSGKHFYCMHVEMPTMSLNVSGHLNVLQLAQWKVLRAIRGES